MDFSDSSESLSIVGSAVKSATEWNPNKTVPALSSSESLSDLFYEIIMKEVHILYSSSPFSLTCPFSIPTP